MSMNFFVFLEKTKETLISLVDIFLLVNLLQKGHFESIF